MRKINKKTFLMGCLAFGLFLTASFILISHAQKKTETQKAENQVQDAQLSEARAAVAKSVVGSVFLDSLLVKEPSWSLDKAGFMERGPLGSFEYLSMLLKKGDSLAGIDIAECVSAAYAEALFDTPTSYGANVPIKGFGDRGEKTIGERGDLIGISFRKGNYFVSIYSRDQKTAESFAAYILKSLDGGVK